jgi:hypothetical protein
MTQWYLRARIRSLLRARAAGHKFKARSADRDSETDRLRDESILRAIDDALGGAEAEYAGLGKRIDDVLTQAALKLGNDGNDSVAPLAVRGQSTDLIEVDVLNSQRRLEDLSARIVHYKILKAALLSGLPDVKPTA